LNRPETFLKIVKAPGPGEINTQSMVDLASDVPLEAAENLPLR
jgi:hypothetical protein